MPCLGRSRVPLSPRPDAPASGCPVLDGPPSLFRLPPRRQEGGRSVPLPLRPGCGAGILPAASLAGGTPAPPGFPKEGTPERPRHRIPTPERGDEERFWGACVKATAFPRHSPTGLVPLRGDLTPGGTLYIFRSVQHKEAAHADREALPQWWQPGCPSTQSDEVRGRSQGAGVPPSRFVPDLALSWLAFHHSCICLRNCSRAPSP